MNKETNYDASTDANMEARSVTENIKDEHGNISKYTFKIYIKNKPAFEGELSREEMASVYNMYSSEGMNLTQREVSRAFPRFTFTNLKRILRAFNITKSCSPLAPHEILEKTSEEASELTLQRKENNFLKKLEASKPAYYEKQLKDTIKALQTQKELNYKLAETITTVKEYPLYKSISKETNSSSKDLILHLSDFHIGAKVRKNSIYDNDYNYSVVKDRLENLLCRIDGNKYDTIVVNILGDMLDGMKMQTARQDHILPQNMDDMEQIKAYLEIMEWFLVSLYSMNICNNIQVYSVKCGNHDGVAAYVATTALFARMKSILPDIQCTLFEEFFGFYEFKNHKFIICHGKDDEFMRQGLPLNIDFKQKVMIYDWLESKKIYGQNIHFIKGDLHSDNLNSCYKMDYRNCLSLFGASDYANYNFERNSYGVSYEILDGQELLRGAFTNL